jgi:hypothetical protein
MMLYKCGAVSGLCGDFAAVKGVSPPCVGPFRALPGRGFLTKTVPRIAEKKIKKSAKIVDKPGRLGYIIDRE